MELKTPKNVKTQHYICSFIILMNHKILSGYWIDETL